MKKTNKEILIMIAWVVMMGFLILISFKVFPVKKAVVTTDKKNYKAGEFLRVKIKNLLNKKFCFSSFPYYFERKTGKWERYQWNLVDENETVEKCITPKGLKMFELEIPPKDFIKAGIHRLAIPICYSCSEKGEFKKEDWLFSNSFLITQD